MAQRRMFSKDIVRSDAFLDMPPSTQLLYFHLGMEADDDGFIGNNKMVARLAGSSNDDIKLLIAKRFILAFPSGVVVVKHWKINNYIQSDRYRQTKYLQEKNLIITKENGAYTENIQNVYKSDTQVRLGKDRIHVEEANTLPDNAYQEIDKKTGELVTITTPLEESQKKDHGLRTDAEKLLELYTAGFTRLINEKPPYFNKAGYLKMVYPHLKEFGLAKMIEFLNAYLNSDDRVYKENRWSISCFLSHKTLHKLNG